MKAYHSDQAVKDKYVNRMLAHIKADELVAGETGMYGKGCAVYCTLDVYDHSRFPTELGIPEWLARVYDTIYEGVPNAEKQKFAIDFLEAPNCGG